MLCGKLIQLFPWLHGIYLLLQLGLSVCLNGQETVLIGLLLLCWVIQIFFELCDRVIDVH